MPSKNVQRDFRCWIIRDQMDHGPARRWWKNIAAIAERALRDEQLTSSDVPYPTARLVVRKDLTYLTVRAYESRLVRESKPADHPTIVSIIGLSKKSCFRSKTFRFGDKSRSRLNLSLHVWWAKSPYFGLKRPAGTERSLRETEADGHLKKVPDSKTTLGALTASVKSRLNIARTIQPASGGWFRTGELVVRCLFNTFSVIRIGTSLIEYEYTCTVDREWKKIRHCCGDAWWGWCYSAPSTSTKSHRVVIIN